MKLEVAKAAEKHRARHMSGELRRALDNLREVRID